VLEKMFRALEEKIVHFQIHWRDIINTTADYSKLSFTDLARAGWPYRLGRRMGGNIEIEFTTPNGAIEKRVIFLGMLPDADQIRLGIRSLRKGKTARDKASPSRGQNPTGHSAIAGPPKGPSNKTDPHGAGKHKGGKRK
jgi:hypothetical protein